MNEDVKRKWVDALRSGDYEQTKNVLRNDGGYCCLGVLCDLAVQEGVIDEWVEDDDEGEFSFYYFGVDTEDGIVALDGELPWPVMEWAGLTESDPTLDRPWFGEGVVTCTMANDTHDKTFGEIADLIEAKL